MLQKIKQFYDGKGTTLDQMLKIVYQEKLTIPIVYKQVPPAKSSNITCR
jgi:hypothetical protein